MMMMIPAPTDPREKERKSGTLRACMSSDMQSEPTKKEAIFHTDDETLSEERWLRIIFSTGCFICLCTKLWLRQHLERLS